MLKFEKVCRWRSSIERRSSSESIGRNWRAFWTHRCEHCSEKPKADARLGPAASDRLARIKRIHELATHVLGERDKASRWLTAASRGLGGEVPLQMLDTDIGTQRVQQELREIEYGMPL